MWLIINSGHHPFVVNAKNKLTFQLGPILQGRLFSKKESRVTFFYPQAGRQEVPLPANSYAFNFLGSTLVVYHNPKRQDTFGPDKVSVKRMELTYPDRKQPVSVASNISSPHAEDVRQHKIQRIDAFLG